MRRDSPWSTSRRTFIKYGLVSTGTAIGAASAATGARDDGDEDRTNDAEADSSAPVAERGAMFPYQVVPGRRVTVVERDLPWRPGGLESTHRAHVISYDHAPSFRAFLFTDSETVVPSDRSLALGRVRGSVSDAGRRVVAVALEPSRVGEGRATDTVSRV